MIASLAVLKEKFEMMDIEYKIYRYFVPIFVNPGFFLMIVLMPLKSTAQTYDPWREINQNIYEFNDYFKENLNSNGFFTSGICPDNNLVEISEIRDHPFMIGSQFHPEFGSRLDKPHPLFDSFIKACINQKKIGAQFKL